MTFRAWVDWAEPYAYGELGLTPWTFWRLTMREFLLMLDGFLRREDRSWYRLGVLGTWVLAPYRKKSHRLTPENLLGRTVTMFPKRRTE